MFVLNVDELVFESCCMASIMQDVEETKYRIRRIKCAPSFHLPLSLKPSPIDRSHISLKRSGKGGEGSTRISGRLSVDAGSLGHRGASSAGCEQAES